MPQPVSVHAKMILFQAGMWILFYLLPYLLYLNGQPNLNTLFRDSGDLIHLSSFLLLVAYSYFNYELLVPRLYLQKKYIYYLCSVAAGILLVIRLPQCLEPALVTPRHSGPPTGPPPILFGMTYNLILFLFSTFTGITIRYRQYVQQIEREKLEAQLSFLRAQINPHFLFNTLNSIYALAIEKSDETPGAIIRLSELMRYLVTDSDSSYVDLAKELQYIDNYVALQRGRLGDTVRIDYSVPTVSENHRIAPLLLMSFIENAFKYGVNPDQESRIGIQLSIEGSALELFVQNVKVAIPVERDDSIGIGLRNVKARLEHLYPGKHRLDIKDSGTNFSVSLQIDLS